MTADMSQRIAEQVRVIVEAAGAIKNVDLALKIMANLHPMELKGNLVTDVIEDMVMKGEIQEVEYLLPTMSDRVKSVYFPAGTVIRINAPHGVRMRVN